MAFCLVMEVSGQLHELQKEPPYPMYMKLDGPQGLFELILFVLAKNQTTAVWPID
jgi:hypothetical protein